MLLTSPASEKWMHRSRNVCDHFVAQILPFFGDTFLPKSLSGYIGTRNNWSILAKATAAQGTDSRASTHCPTGGGAVVPQALRAGWAQAGRCRTLGSIPAASREWAAAAPQPRAVPARSPRAALGRSKPRLRLWLEESAAAAPAIGPWGSGRARHWLPADAARGGGGRGRWWGSRAHPLLAAAAAPPAPWWAPRGRPHCPGPGRVCSARRRARGGREGAKSTWEAGSRAPALCFEGR